MLGGFNSGAYSFYPNGLAEWDTLKTVLRMATIYIYKDLLTIKKGDSHSDFGLISVKCRYDAFLCWTMKEEFEDTKGVIRIRKGQTTH